MRRFLIGLCILVGGVYACQRVDNESVCGVLYTQEVDTSLVKKYVYENRFIDIDIYAVARMIWAGEQVDTDVMAQVKVALYRYFSHVRIERDKYVCYNKKGTCFLQMPLYLFFLKSGGDPVVFFQMLFVM